MSVDVVLYSLQGSNVEKGYEGDTDKSLSDLEIEAERISDISKKTWESVGCYGGAIAAGILIGCAGIGITNEIVAKVNDFAVPKILQLVPILVMVAAVAIYVVVAIPIILHVRL